MNCSVSRRDRDKRATRMGGGEHGVKELGGLQSHYHSCTASQGPLNRLTVEGVEELGFTWCSRLMSLGVFP